MRSKGCQLVSGILLSRSRPRCRRPPARVERACAHQDRLRAQRQKRDHPRAKPGVDHDTSHCHHHCKKTLHDRIPASFPSVAMRAMLNHPTGSDFISVAGLDRSCRLPTDRRLGFCICQIEHLGRQVMHALRGTRRDCIERISCPLNELTSRNGHGPESTDNPYEARRGLSK